MLGCRENKLYGRLLIDFSVTWKIFLSDGAWEMRNYILSPKFIKHKALLKQLAVCSQISCAISVDTRAVFNRTSAVCF